MVKMGLDMTPILGHKTPAGAVENFNMLADIEVLLSLSVFIPLVNAVHCLIKLSQGRDIFICDFLSAVKLCQAELARMFVDPETCFSKEDFPVFSDLVDLSSRDIPMEWAPLPGDSGISHLFFNFEFTRGFARCHDKQNGNHIFVTQEEYNRVQDNVQRQFSGKFVFFFLNVC